MLGLELVDPKLHSVVKVGSDLVYSEVEKSGACQKNSGVSSTEL